MRDETRLTAGVAQRLAAESQEVATNLEEVERLTSASGEAVRQLHSVGADMARQASLLTDTTAQTASAMQDVKHAITRVRETATSSHKLPSGPLHDAAEVARASIPVVMMFTQSLAGLSHNPAENTRIEHLELAVQAFDRLARKTMQWLSVSG